MSDSDRPAGLSEGERAAMVARALDDWQAGFPAEKKGAPMTLAQIFGLARAMFDAGLAASVSPVSVEGGGRRPAQGKTMIALLRAASEVRGGMWIKGAPTHVLAELLNVLDANGWRLTRKATDD